MNLKIAWRLKKLLGSKRDINFKKKGNIDYTNKILMVMVMGRGEETPIGDALLGGEGEPRQEIRRFLILFLTLKWLCSSL